MWLVRVSVLMRSRRATAGRSGRGSRGACAGLRGYVLVIAEKPKAARRIAEALGGGSARYCRGSGRAGFWVLRFNGSLMVVASAVGHLFGLHTEERGFPVFSYEWRPLWAIDRGAAYTRPYYELLRRLSRDASLFVNACDYDIEGSVIGYLVIRFFGDLRRARRAKFSSLTAPELRRAFSRLEPLDYDMVEAGLARHELDWIWGINVSRALMDSVKAATGRRVVLSAGRVQSPTLREAVRRDLERRLHVPLPLFRVSAVLRRGEWRRTVTARVVEERAEARRAAEAIRRSGKAVVAAVEKRRARLPRPYPFNLPDLQTEAARVFGFSPMFTQRVAEELYLDGLISYPRTNSQKLPPSLDLSSILRGLSGLRQYSGLVRLVEEMTGGRLRPRNGPRDDPAHPAIYPTGVVPREPLTGAKAKLYDLIVKRFLATISVDALVSYTSVTLVLGDGSRVKLTGARVENPGWLRVYEPYGRVAEEELPPLKRGDVLEVERVSVRTEYVKPPEQYTKLMLVRWMERVGIGTEATRARIVELLFERGYLESRRGKIRATELGIAVSEFLDTYFRELTSVELTRVFEKLLNDIRFGRAERGKVIEEAKRLLSERLRLFKERHMLEAGRRLGVALSYLRPRRSCVLCSREAVEGEALCKLHLEAYRRLREAYPLWVKRGAAQSWNDYVRSVARLRATGELVAEVARAVMEGRLPSP